MAFAWGELAVLTDVHGGDHHVVNGSASEVGFFTRVGRMLASDGLADGNATDVSGLFGLFCGWTGKPVANVGGMLVGDGLSDGGRLDLFCGWTRSKTSLRAPVNQLRARVESSQSGSGVSWVGCRV